MSTIRVALPAHLRTLAHVHGDVSLDIEGALSVDRVLDALEARFPMLRGTIRDHATKRRRAFMRYFACGSDISHEPTDQELPEPIASGVEPLVVIGAISGG